jgi:penicillin G amidase
VSFVVDVPGVQGEVLIVRDGFGIPHVRASCTADAWFGMGYACAQDRLFQMDYDRRRAAGRWAEVAGPVGVPGDVLSRRMGITEAAHADLGVMSAPVRDMFEAYARGVNAVIATGVCPPGLEGTVIEPWQAWHSVAAYKVRHILMGMWQHKLAEAMLLARTGPEVFGQLDTRSPAGSPLSVPPDGRLAEAIAEAVEEIARAAPHLGFLSEAEPGSNAWAVSGRRTAHGGAVLCNDSHRALDSPNVYWQCHLDCPDFQVTGATFPGVPGFPHFGHNGHVAWAITHAHADTQDLYLERFDPSRPGWYETEDGWAQASQRTEKINVRDGATASVTIWATRHGPVVHGDPRTGTAIALKYTATCRPGRGFEPLLPMLSARDVAGLCDSQRDWVDPVNNLVAADTSGRIAYQARGELPVRSSADARRLPVPGWDGRSEWTGIVPFESMPRAIDPAAGFVMTANNVIAEGDEPYITYSFGHPFRAERIRELLTATGQHTTEDLAAMQGDMTSWAAQGWGRVLAGLEPLGDEDGERARVMLAGWDGVLDGGSAPALLYGCLLRALAAELYRPLAGERTWHWLTTGPVAAVAPIRRWLANDTWALLGGPTPDDGTAARDAARKQRVLGVLPGALAAAWREASKAGPPQHWRWSDHHTISALHPLSADLAPAPVGMGGDSETIQAAAYGWAQGTSFEVILTSVYRQVVDLAAPERASSVIPGGASGDPASPHFADQLAQWARQQRVPMLWDWADIEAGATASTTLRPDPTGRSVPAP